MTNDRQASAGSAGAPLSLDRCLVIWGAWERGYQGGPQPVKVATWARMRVAGARADGSAESQLSSSDRWIAQHVSKAIDALPNRDWQTVLEIEYIFNGSVARVWRSNRLPHDREALNAMLDAARTALEPILQRRIGVRLAVDSVNR